jgi:hypothetical protein
MAMAYFWVVIETNNAAFEGDAGPYEVSRILKEVARKVEDLHTLPDMDHGPHRVYDENGNHVGHFDLDDAPGPRHATLRSLAGT